MTYPTYELMEIIHRDAAFLSQRDAEWENKRRRRAGKAEIEPLYTNEDVNTALALCEGLPYGRRQQVAKGIEVCFRDAGHILGSAIVELYIHEHGKEKSWSLQGILVIVMEPA
jgi:metallo-beta-lactamase family protein